MIILTIKQTEILELLAKYKYLSTSQLLLLGFGVSKRTITGHLYSIKQRARPLVGEIKGGVLPNKGALEIIYYLSPHGVKALQDLGFDLKDIRYPKASNTISLKDYFHRKSTVNFHIMLDKWINQHEYELDFIHFYFDKAGNNRDTEQKGPIKAITRIDIKDGDFIIPDAVFKFSANGTKHLFLFEMINGKDTKRALSQIAKHQKALKEGTPTDKYKHSKANRVILLFEQEGTKNAVIKRAKELSNYSAFINNFLISTSEKFENDFYGCWQNFDGQRINFI